MYVYWFYKSSHAEGRGRYSRIRHYTFIPEFTEVNRIWVHYGDDQNAPRELLCMIRYHRDGVVDNLCGTTIGRVTTWSTSVWQYSREKLHISVHTSSSCNLLTTAVVQQELWGKLDLYYDAAPFLGTEIIHNFSHIFSHGAYYSVLTYYCTYTCSRPVGRVIGIGT